MAIKIIAEAGVNHNGNLELARQMVAAAAEAGADYIKFQTFIPEKLVSASAQKDGLPETEYWGTGKPAGHAAQAGSAAGGFLGIEDTLP